MHSSRVVAFWMLAASAMVQWGVCIVNTLMQSLCITGVWGLLTTLLTTHRIYASTVKHTFLTKVPGTSHQKVLHCVSDTCFNCWSKNSTLCLWLKLKISPTLREQIFSSSHTVFRGVRLTISFLVRLMWGWQSMARSHRNQRQNVTLLLLLLFFFFFFFSCFFCGLNLCSVPGLCDPLCLAVNL